MRCIVFEEVFQNFLNNEEKYAENSIIILAIINIIIFIVLSLLILYFLFNWSFIENIFDFFGKNDLILIFNSIDTGKLILLLTGFFLYLYLFGYIRSRPITIFEGKEEGAKYLLIFDKCIEIFTPSIVILLFFVYLYNFMFYYELIIVATIFIIFTNSAMLLLIMSSRIKSNYNSIRRINNFKFILDEYLTFYPNTGKFLKIVTGLSDKVKDSFLLLSISFLIIGWNLSWNIFSLILLTISIIILYIAHNFFTSIPKNTVNFIFNDQTNTIEEVYILKQTPEGYFLILTRVDALIFINKDNIAEIQFNKPYSLH